MGGRATPVGGAGGFATGLEIGGDGGLARGLVAPVKAGGGGGCAPGTTEGFTPGTTGGIATGPTGGLATGAAEGRMIEERTEDCGGPGGDCFGA